MAFTSQVRLLTARSAISSLSESDGNRATSLAQSGVCAGSTSEKRSCRQLRKGRKQIQPSDAWAGHNEITATATGNTPKCHLPFGGQNSFPSSINQPSEHAERGKLEQQPRKHQRMVLIKTRRRRARDGKAFP